MTIKYQEKQSSCIAELRQLAKDYDCVNLASVVIEDEKFQIWSGSHSPNLHHFGRCGLLVHTHEVVNLCLSSNRVLKDAGKGIDEKELYLAALFHDIGKTYDYTPSRVSSVNDDVFLKQRWEKTQHKRRIHHISRSALIWNEAARQENEELRENVLHAILAHHGRREWGSPVAPAIPLAWTLHLCDGISARTEDWDTIEIERIT